MPCSARDLYTGALFRKSVTFAEATCDQWLVLSAEHALLHPDTVVAPYDTRLGDRRTGPPIWEWVDRVVASLISRFDAAAPLHLVLLAGATYRTVTVRLPPAWTHEAPMQGLGIGRQLAWLNAATAATARTGRSSAPAAVAPHGPIPR